MQFWGFPIPINPLGSSDLGILRGIQWYLVSQSVHQSFPLGSLIQWFHNERPLYLVAISAWSLMRVSNVRGSLVYSASLFLKLEFSLSWTLYERWRFSIRANVYKQIAHITITMWSCFHLACRKQIRGGRCSVIYTHCLETFHKHVKNISSLTSNWTTATVTIINNSCK